MVEQLREKLATTKGIKNDIRETVRFKQFRKHLLQVEKILMKSIRIENKNIKFTQEWDVCLQHVGILSGNQW